MMSKLDDFFKNGGGYHSCTGPLNVLPEVFPSLSQKFLKKGPITFFTEGPFKDALLKNNDSEKKPVVKVKQTTLQMAHQMKMNVNG